MHVLIDQKMREVVLLGKISYLFRRWRDKYYTKQTKANIPRGHPVIFYGTHPAPCCHTVETKVRFNCFSLRLCITTTGCLETNLILAAQSTQSQNIALLLGYWYAIQVPSMWLPTLTIFILYCCTYRPFQTVLWKHMEISVTGSGSIWIDHMLNSDNKR